MHFIDQYKELYPDPKPVEPVAESLPVKPPAEKAKATPVPLRSPKSAE